MLSLSKLLTLLAVIAALLGIWRTVKGIYGSQNRSRTEDSKPEAKTLDLKRCPHCGTFTSGPCDCRDEK